MLIERLRTERITAMKERNVIVKTVLTTLLGELEGIAKRNQSDITDAMIIATCKKFISSNLEVIDKGGCLDTLETENAVLDNYIPKQLTKDELGVIIESIKADNLGAVMKYLKENHNGTYDGKLAANVANTVLSR